MLMAFLGSRQGDGRRHRGMSYAISCQQNGAKNVLIIKFGENQVTTLNFTHLYSP